MSHIIEEPVALGYLTDVACPTEEYYIMLSADMLRRHPKASKDVLEHLSALEVLLDTSILSGFSYGAAKAKVVENKKEPCLVTEWDGVEPTVILIESSPFGISRLSETKARFGNSSARQIGSDGTYPRIRVCGQSPR